MATLVRPGPTERRRYPYEPQPKQASGHWTFADEVLYGGAAGGGKTEWLLAEAVKAAVKWPRSAGVIFRRSFPDLSRPGGIIDRLLGRMPKEVATYHATEHKWTFRNGSLLELAHLDTERDLAKYQGAEYQFIGFDQLEQFTERQYRYMSSRLRAAGPVAEAMAKAGARSVIRATANPGGVGHVWVKERFIDPAPPYVVWLPSPTEDEPEPGTRAFVPALHTDNAFLEESYRRRLRNLPEDDRRALEEGDWDVFTGQRFKQFRRSIHVIDPEDLPIPIGGITRAMGVDYGLVNPWVALWGAKLADGLIVVYREAWAVELTPKEQAERILSLELRGERRQGRPVPVYLDPSTFARDPREPIPKERAGRGRRRAPSGSIAADYEDAGLPVERANNDRLRGAALLDQKLRVQRDGRPRILIYSTCRYLIKSIPSLVRDTKRPEDVDTNGDDHPYDALRYLMAGLEAMPGGAGEPAKGGPGEPLGDRGRRHTGPTVTGELRRKGF